MGSLTEGFEAARRRRDEQLAERHRKEGVVDHELHELSDLLRQDAEFLKSHGVTYEVVNRAMHVLHRQLPVATIHYAPESQEYSATVMHDGSHATMKTAPECAQAIGEMLFVTLKPQ